MADRYDWPANNIVKKDDPAHFYVLLTFDGKIDEPSSNPSAWIIPSGQIGRFMKQYKTRWVVSRMLVMKNGGEFKDAWGQLTGQQ